MLNSNENKYTHLLLGGLSFYDMIGNQNIFNAGVGGDKVENIIYRLVESRLFDHINLQNLSNIFILAGTNNLNNKKLNINLNIY